MSLQFSKNNYFRRLIDEDDPASIKRFTVLSILMHYMVTCFAALFMSKTIANRELISMITEYNFYIILVGIFGLTIETLGNIMVKKAGIMASAAPPVTVENAESVNTTTNTTQAKTLNAENVETVNSQNTNVAAKKDEEPQDL